MNKNARNQRAAQTQALLQEAMGQHQAGNLHEAEAGYRRILSYAPDHADAMHLLGVVHNARGEFAQAAERLQAVLKRAPQFAGGYCNLGIALSGLGRPDEALAAHRRAMEIAPGYADAYVNFANVLISQGKCAEAENFYRQALERDANNANALSGLGLALLYLARPGEAKDALAQSLTLQPNASTAHLNMGHALACLGEPAESAAHYAQAITLDPRLAYAHAYWGNIAREVALSSIPMPTFIEHVHIQAQAHAYLAHALFSLKKMAASEQAFRQAIGFKPDAPEHYLDLGWLLEIQGRLADAGQCYKQAEQTGQPVVGALWQALMISPLPASAEEIVTHRTQMQTRLDALLAREPIALADPFKQWGKTNFYLAYQGGNDRDLQRRTAQLYLKLCPALAYTSAHIESLKTKPSGGRIRIGVMSAYFYDHTIGKLNKGWIERMDRSRFELIWLRSNHKRDVISLAIEQCFDRIIDLPMDLAQARARIADEAPDVLFYPDIGMDSFSYFMAFARLAPVQCVSWGHPVTTGIPNLDYFISAESIEAENAEAHYSERLVKFAQLPCCYEPPKMTPAAKTRADFGLPDDARLYVCPQTLFKFHPDYDTLLGEILRRDKKGLLMLIEGTYPEWTQRLHARFARAFPDAAGRVRFLPAMKLADFLALMKLADALLDPPCFGGGNSSYEALAMGCPVVTWPGEFMRGRVTEGCYRQMGIPDLIARSREEYVSLAVTLANDAALKNTLSEKIRANASLLFNTESSVREFEAFFAQAVQAAKQS